MITEIINIFNKFWDRRARDIIIGCIGKIHQFDPSTMRADVIPLLEYTAEGASRPTKFSIISDVPVQFLFSGGYFIRPYYAKDDLVWLTFATFDISRGLKGITDPADGSMFGRENASVVHGLARANWTIPDGFSDPGLLVGHKDGGMFFQLSTDQVTGRATKLQFEGDVEISGNLSVSDNVEADGEITAKKNTASVNLSTHIHNTSSGPSTAPVTGS